MECIPGLYRWNVYHEPADTNELARLIGTILADTMALVLDSAAQHDEIPQHDLVVRRSDLEVRTEQQDG